MSLEESVEPDARLTRRSIETRHEIESFPTVRRGRLLQASVGGKTKTFTVDEGELALERIDQNVDQFHSAIRKGLRSGAAEFGFEDAIAGPPPSFLLGKSARRNSGLGAVFDFDEISINLNDAWLLLCRSASLFAFGTI